MFGVQVGGQVQQGVFRRDDAAAYRRPLARRDVVDLGARIGDHSHQVPSIDVSARQACDHIQRAVAIARTVGGQPTARRIVHRRPVLHEDAVARTQQVGDDLARLLGVGQPCAFADGVFGVHRTAGVEAQGDVAVARRNVEQRVGLLRRDAAVERDAEVDERGACRLDRRQQDRPVLVADLLETARHHRDRVAGGIEGERGFGQTAHAACAVGHFPARQEGNRAGGFAHHGDLHLARFQDGERRGDTGEAYVEVVVGAEAVDPGHQPVERTVRGEGADVILADLGGAQHFGGHGGLGGHEVDAQLCAGCAVYFHLHVGTASLGFDLVVARRPLVGCGVRPTLDAAGHVDILRQRGQVAKRIAVVIQVDQLRLCGRVGPVLGPVGGKEVEEELAFAQPAQRGDQGVQDIECILVVTFRVVLVERIDAVPGVADGADRPQPLDEVFVEDVAVTLGVHGGGGVVGCTAVPLGIRGSVHRVGAQVGISFDELRIVGIVWLQVAVAAVVVGVLQVVLRLVVDRGLAATAAHHRRVDADAAVAGAAPVGDARPADAVLHLDVDGVAAAIVVEVMAGIGVEALPGVLEPGGHLLRLRVAVDPVLQVIVDAIFHARRRAHHLGVIDFDRLVDAANWKRAGDALVQQQSINRRAAGAGGRDTADAHVAGG